MISKNTKTIVFAALIAAMILPFSGMQSAEADNHGENLTIEELQDIIDVSEARIIHHQARLISAEAIYDQRTALIIEYQSMLAGLDAIVNNGGVLSDEQIAFYDYIVNEIISLESQNVITAGRISNHYSQIARHQAAIAWAQAEIDSRL